MSGKISYNLMAKPENNSYSIREKFLKDIIYIALFALSLMSSCSGWKNAIESKSAVVEKLNTTVNNNTKVLENLSMEIKQINDFLFIQQELNGQFKEFMYDMKRRDKSLNK